MNHYYRLVFNHSVQVWQAVAEFAKARQKSKGASSKGESQGKLPVATFLPRLKKLAICVALNLAFVTPNLVHALPAGADIQFGQATFQTNGNNLTINQGSTQLIANWQSFGIASNESVHLLQPNQGVALFRVVGPEASQIYGSLNATGGLFLVNPNGVLFGQGAQVDVGSLVATSMNISNTDFLGGHYEFNADVSTGSIVNQGVIKVADGGYIVLLANQVKNSGTLTADNGSIVLGSAQSAMLDFYGNGLVKARLSGDALSALVENTGSIQADAGAVQLATNSRSSAVNVSGLVQANSLVKRNGVIHLEGGDNAKVSVRGTLSAAGNHANTKGGNIEVTGEQVALFKDAKLDASGDTGGGTVLVGGDYQGKNTQVYNARTTFVDKDASINTDAKSSGDGGRAIVWADEITRYYGNISAKGGALSGNGGFVEVSGKDILDFIGGVDVSAARGLGGLVLLDPQDIVLNTTTQASPPNNINGTPDLAFGDAPAAGTATIQIADITGFSELFLQATNNITIASALTMAANNSIRLEANNNIAVNAALTVSGTGSVNLRADADNSGVGNLAIGANITSQAGGITLGGATITRTAGNITASGAANGNAGNINISATGAINLTAATVTATGGTASAGNVGRNGGTISISGASVTTTGAITANGSNGNGTNQAGGNAGTVSVTSTGTVNTAGITARTGSATGTGAGGAIGSVGVGGTNVAVGAINTSGQNNGNGGTITVNATGTLDLNGAIASSGGTAITGNAGKNAGAVSLSAGNTITAAAAATINANGSNGVGANQGGGNGAAITISASGDASLRAMNANGGNGVATNAAGGNAGSISIATNNGNITTNAGNLSARTGIGRGTGANSVEGFITINNTSAAGTINTRAINTSGQANGAGGNVTLAGNGNVTVGGAINTNAGGVTGTRAGLKAGDVSISGANVTTTAGAITAIGSTAVGTNQNGGNAGAISLVATGALNTGVLNADGGNATGTGTRGFAASTTLTADSMNIGALTVRSGNGAGTPNVNHNITTTGTGISTIASINTTVNGALNMNVADTLTVAGVIQGTGVSVNKSGSGTLVLSGANTYTGATNINTGTLQANNGAALGAVGGGTMIASGATLNVNNVTLAESALTINGTGVANAGAITGTGTANVSGTVTTASNSSIGTTTAASTLNLTGVTTAASNLGIVGAGNVTVTNAANNFSTVNINGANNVSLRDVNGINLGNGASNLTGNLDLVTNGAITQTAAVTVGGTTSITAGAANDVTLNNVANNFNSVAIVSGRNVSIVDANALTVNASSVRTISAQTLSDDLTLGGTITATGAGSGSSIVLAAAQNFLNPGNSALTPGAGSRWLVYSTNPTADTRGAGLITSSNFKQYNTGFPDTISGTGNGFAYTVAPTITASLGGVATKTYDGTTTAPIGSLTLGQSGAIDGDTVNISTLTSATYDDKNAGTGKTVTSNTLNITSATNGGKQVFGYTLANSTASSNVGTIDQRAITVSAATDTKTYDGTTSSVGPPTVTSGTIVAGDIGTFSQTFGNKNAGTNKTLTATGSVTDGNGGGNYAVTFATNNTGVIDKANLTITANPGQSKIFGAVDPLPFTFTIGGSGLFGGDTLLGALDRAAGETVGNYAINQGTLDAGSNYTINYIGSTFAVLAPDGSSGNGSPRDAAGLGSLLVINDRPAQNLTVLNVTAPAAGDETDIENATEACEANQDQKLNNQNTSVIFNFGIKLPKGIKAVCI